MATYSLTQETVNVPNHFDQMGLLLGLPRLPGEKNPDYRLRLLDVYTRRAGSNLTGLVNGITRELGLDQYDALTISTSSSTYPRVIVHDTEIQFYSKWRISTDYVLEGTLDIFSRDSDSYYLDGLISEINDLASFSASLASGIDGHTPSFVLTQTDSRQWQDNEEIKPMHRIHLDNTAIIKGSLKFSYEGRNIYVSEKTSEDNVTSAGDYYVDYTNGILYSYSLPSVNITCRYMYDELPLTVSASPVSLFEFGSDRFLDKVFQQVLMPDGTYEDGLPEHEAVDLINELFEAKPMLWGA